METSLVGVNTLVPNRLLAETINAKEIKELNNFETLQREVRVGDRSRLDLKLEKKGLPSCFIEIKNCTLVQHRTALFPDAVTARGQKHLKELMDLVENGNRCVMFFLIQRMDAEFFAPADRIDPVYGERLRQAAALGVELIAYDVAIDLKQIRVRRRLPIQL